MKGTTRTFIIALAMATILATIATGAAVAGKGGGGHHQSARGGGTISLVVLNGATEPHYGGQVTFTVSTTATPEPHVRLQCFQSGALVYSAQAGFYASYPWPWLQNMTLSSSSWTSGAADCIAQIYYFDGRKTVWSTSLSFHVDA